MNRTTDGVLFIVCRHFCKIVIIAPTKIKLDTILVSAFGNLQFLLFLVT